ncbi:MAG: FtsQ-type POTRA domain-containing protein [Deltaproteobacteria bacterium]|nr:MAG: FtsQ-type POTRA domain-containing protein [Deltaproteobacteria bacterium]
MTKRFRNDGRRRGPVGRGQPPRFALEAARRRHRARDHLARVRARRGQTAPPRRVRAPLLLAAAAIAAALLAAAWLAPALRDQARTALRGQSLVLETIAVEGVRRVTPAEIARSAGLEAGVSLVDVDVAAVEQRVRAHPWVARARALRLPPSTLLVRVTERVPVAILAGAAPARLVDREGVPFAAAAPSDVAALPRIVGADAATPDEPNADLATAVALIGAIAALGIPEAEEIAIAPAADPAGFSFRQRGSAAHAVLGRDAFDAKLARFAELLGARRPETAAASRIDLRFQDQVVLEGVPPRNGAEQAASGRGGAPTSTAERSG